NGCGRVIAICCGQKLRGLFLHRTKLKPNCAISSRPLAGERFSRFRVTFRGVCLSAIERNDREHENCFGSKPLPGLRHEIATWNAGRAVSELSVEGRIALA